MPKTKKVKKRRKRKVLKYPKWMKRITHKQFIYRDFDHDGMANIDDQKPFDPTNKKSIDPFGDSLFSREFRELERIRKAYKPAKIAVWKKLRHNVGDERGRRFKKTNVKVTSRLKSLPSIINKMRRKVFPKGKPALIKDIAGLMVTTRGFKRLQTSKKKIGRLRFKTFKIEDFYNNNLMFPIKTGKKKYKQKINKPYYRALHYDITFNRKPVEIQLKTKRQLKLHTSMHKGHKTGRDTGKLTKSQATRRADKYHFFDLRRDLNR